MRSFLFLCVLFVCFFSCSNDKESLEELINNINEKCPIEEPCWSVDSLGISSNGDIVYFCNTNKNSEFFDLLKSRKDSITNAMVDKLNNDKVENSMGLIKLCKKYDAGIIYKFSSTKTNEKLIIKIPHTKLIVDPEKY